MTDTKKYKQPLPTHTSANWRYRPRNRGTIGVVTAVTFLMTLLWQPFLALAILALGGVLTLPATNGRTYVYSVVSRIWPNRRLRRRRGRYQPKLVRDIIYSDDEDDHVVPTNPVQVNFLPMDDKGREYLTEVHTRDNGLHTLYVLYDTLGEAHTGDPEDLLDRARTFTDLTQVLATNYGPGLRVSMFKVAMPHDPTGEMGWFEKNRYIPKEPDLTVERSQLNFQEAIASQENNGNNFLCGFAVTVVRPKEWSGLQPHNLRTPDIIRSQGYKLTRQLIEMLQDAGASNVRRPDPYETAILLRGTLDPMSLPRLYRAWREDRRRFDLHQIDTLLESMVLAEGPIQDGHQFVGKLNYLRVCDSTYTRVWHAPDFDRRLVDPDFMPWLSDLPPHLRAGITLVYRVGDPKFQERVMKHRFNVEDARSWRRKREDRPARAKELEQEALVREEDEVLHSSGGIALRLRLLVHISAESKAELEELSLDLEKIFNGVQMPLSVINGDTAQYQARIETLGIPAA